MSDQPSGAAETGVAATAATDPGAATARPATVIGVVGAGTLGAGIAQRAARAGARTLLHDPLTEALERGAQRARAGLEKEAAKGRLSPEEAAAASERLQAVDTLEA